MRPLLCVRLRSRPHKRLTNNMISCSIRTDWHVCMYVTRVCTMCTWHDHPVTMAQTRGGEGCLPHAATGLPALAGGSCGNAGPASA